MPRIGIGLGLRSAGGSPFDPAITAFAAASGATDLTPLNNLAKYLRSQSLISSVRCFPFKSAQNAGSGSTVYGWGDLTANNCTLVNSPAWGAGGLEFSAASSQYARVSDFISSETLTVFARLAHTEASPTARQIIASQYDLALNKRSWILDNNGSVAGEPYDITRSSLGTGGDEIYRTTDHSYATTDQTIVAQWVDGAGRSIWQNKTARTLSLVAGAARTSRYNSDQDVLIGAVVSASPVLFASMSLTAILFVVGPLATGQRESITDLINAL